MSNEKGKDDVGKNQEVEQEGKPVTDQDSAQPQTAARPRKPKQDKPPDNDQGIWRMNRRNVFTFAGWLAFFGFLTTATLGFLRYLFPRVLFEPPTAFRAGRPDDYVIGEVDSRWMDLYRVWIVRTRTGLYALRAICTHLGCTPRWLEIERQFKCPCHGSGFTIEGINFEGPAPRPLERLHITMEAGEIIIDRGIRYRQELGEWALPGAFLEYS